MKGKTRSPDNPDEWLRRAESSLALAGAKTPGVLYEDLCYQAQQAAEKALKAVFVARKIPYPYTHDINALLSTLGKQGIPVPEDLWDAVTLTSYASDTRYPGFEQPVEGVRSGCCTGSGSHPLGSRTGQIIRETSGRTMKDPDLRIANRHIAMPEEIIRAFCKKWNIHRFSFYGSIMRDDFRPDSDIDVMIEFSPDDRTSLFDMNTMQAELEELFSRKVDIADRRSVEQSENYIRRKGMLSGKPPVLRQMSYLLDMLIAARNIRKITGNSSPESIDKDEMAFHAISHGCWELAVSAQRVDAPTRLRYPDLPWDLLVRTYETFETDFCRPDKDMVKEIAWQVVPRIIPILDAIIPPEDSI
ncbi:HEPN domain-containing protein [Methanoregula sp.]|uniref:HEPN domain-containing protein n=1 Tax=Methanoregula sp. TaxID=2052170 RepID=UPI00236D63F9|nr:HEPN domain-containing protein [Methanoregula sp.]MDD1686172.1 HEPN domain-containing protein [Methanoregula sp.]